LRIDQAALIEGTGERRSVTRVSFDVCCGEVRSPPPSLALHSPT
jgi:hypothetical protein